MIWQEDTSEGVGGSESFQTSLERKGSSTGKKHDGEIEKLTKYGKLVHRKTEKDLVMTEKTS